MAHDVPQRDAPARAYMRTWVSERRAVAAGLVFYLDRRTGDADADAKPARGRGAVQGETWR